MQNQRDDIFVWSAVLWGARTKRLCPGGGAAARAVCAAAACGGCRQTFSFSHGRAQPLISYTGLRMLALGGAQRCLGSGAAVVALPRVSERVEDGRRWHPSLKNKGWKGGLRWVI